MGAITPLGHSVIETWEALVDGQSGVRHTTVADVSEFPSKISGEIQGLSFPEYLSTKKQRGMTFTSKIAVIAANEAVQDSGINMKEANLTRVGVLLGTSAASTIEEGEQATREFIKRGSRRVSPAYGLRFWPNMPSYFIAEQYGSRGYSGTICTACASATQAIGEAAELIKRGTADVMITGGADSSVSLSAFASFVGMGAIATSYNEEPHRAMRPWDLAREGFIWAQGSAILVMESLEHAQARGAHIYAEIVGFGVTNDHYHQIAPNPEGAGAALAMRLALQSADLPTTAVDYINAHGTSTPLGDVAETRAIRQVFEERANQIPTNSTKSMLGHSMGAGGAIEAVVCIKSIEDGILHPTINYETPDPECDLDYVPNQSRRVDVRVAMSNSFGMGGQNAVLILSAFD
jgi:3-oxoacyl-[acyl-carrier-protein] synthase II